MDTFKLKDGDNDRRSASVFLVYRSKVAFIKDRVGEKHFCCVKFIAALKGRFFIDDRCE